MNTAQKEERVCESMLDYPREGAFLHYKGAQIEARRGFDGEVLDGLFDARLSVASNSRGFDITDVVLQMQKLGIPMPRPKNWKDGIKSLCQVIVAAIDKGVIAVPCYMSGTVHINRKDLDSFRWAKIDLSVGEVELANLFRSWDCNPADGCYFGNMDAAGLTLDDVTAIVKTAAKFKAFDCVDTIDYYIAGEQGRFQITKPGVYQRESSSWEDFETSLIQFSVLEEVSERYKSLDGYPATLVVRLAEEIRKRMKEEGRQYWTVWDVRKACDEAILKAVEAFEKSLTTKTPQPAEVVA